MLNPPRFEFAVESGYLFGVFDPPQDYQIATEFVTGRVRWGVIDGPGLGVEVDEAFLHCAKAFKRSALWRPEEWPETDGLARAAQIWRDHMAVGMTMDEVQDFVDDDYANNLTWR